MLYLATQLAGQALALHNPLTRLRSLGSGDQLGYLAIASNAAGGDFSLAEPFTQTGVNHYPHLYYMLIGAISGFTSVDVSIVWNVVGLSLQAGAVLIMALVMSSLSRRWWMGIFAPAVFVTGTFAVYMSGDWFTLLQHHSVLWGPFAALFSKNGEGAGLSLGVISVSLLFWAWGAPRGPKTRIGITLAASAIAGMLSSFQTYSFIVLIYALAYCVAAIAIGRSTRRGLWLSASLVLVGIVFAVGPIVAEAAGQLPTLIFGLAAAIPGLLLAVVQSRGLVAAAALAAASTALPQVVYTYSGVASGDPFLTYRVASNVGLGIVDWRSLIAALPVLVPLIGAGVIAAMRGNAALASTAIGAAVSLTLLAVNDVWGANAEPYRFWINGFLLGGVIAALAWSRLLRAEPVASTSVADATSTRVSASRGRSRSQRTSIAATSLLISTAVLWSVALPDWIAYSLSEEAQASFSLRTDRERAIGSLASSTTEDGGLITTDVCGNPLTLKVTSGAAVAHYALGMAWPIEKEAIDDLNDARHLHTLDFPAMERADIRWVLTDSLCSYDLGSQYPEELELVDERPYTLASDEAIYPGGPRSGSVRLWRVAIP